MTDSTDSARGPERIWATGDGVNGSWTSRAIPKSWGADAQEYIRADLPPKVKPLEWDDVQVETPFGTYDFGYVGRVWTLRFCGNQIEYGIAGSYRTARAEAKDAAQHHFDTRILSTLKPTGGKDD